MHVHNLLEIVDKGPINCGQMVNIAALAPISNRDIPRTVGSNFVRADKVTDHIAGVRNMVEAGGETTCPEIWEMD